MPTLKVDKPVISESFFNQLYLRKKKMCSDPAKTLPIFHISWFHLVLLLLFLAGILQLRGTAKHSITEISDFDPLSYCVLNLCNYFFMATVK